MTECVLNMSVGCGEGLVCRGQNSATAYCGRCDFNRSVSHCRSYLLTDSSPSNETHCTQGPVVVYTGTQLSFTGIHALTLSSVLYCCHLQTSVKTLVNRP